jgi:hypothetical protein
MKTVLGTLAGVVLAATAFSHTVAADAGKPSAPDSIQSFTLALSPGEQTTAGIASIRLDWSGYDVFNEVFYMDYGDSSPIDAYRCGSNCQVGYTYFSHTYASVGTYSAQVHDTRSPANYSTYAIVHKT